MKLINPLPPDAFYLYHYTSTETAIKYILSYKTLRFNSYSAVNDPRESKQWDMMPTVRPYPVLDLEDYEKLSKLVSAALKQYAKLVCFSEDRDEAIGKLQPGALFDRGFAKPCMWHHYANACDGICLMFDKKKLDLAFNEQLDVSRLISGSVHYSNEGILPDFRGYPFSIDLTRVHTIKEFVDSIEAHRAKWLSHLFLRKLIDWENEVEYRWIYFDHNTKPIHVNYRDALEGIVIGEGVSSTLYDEIYEYGKQHKVEVAKLHWRNGFPIIINPM